MRVLTGLDYGILAGYLVAVFGLGMLLTRRAGRSIEDFFVGGRQMPWGRLLYALSKGSTSA
jgi:Na+/proline symporter